MSNGSGNVVELGKQVSCGINTGMIVTCSTGSLFGATVSYFQGFKNIYFVKNLFIGN